MKWVVPVTRPRRILWPSTVFLVTAAVAILTPLAAASPTDPTWVVGVYDADDSDDAILLVDSTFCMAAAWSDWPLVLTLAPADLNPVSEASVRPDRPPRVCEGRGPPPA